MTNSTYQLIILGNQNKFDNLIRKTLSARVNELGLADNFIKIINRFNFVNEYRANNPVVVVYYGGDEHLDLEIVEKLKKDASIILPIFNGSDSFNQDIPASLHAMNGVKVESEMDIDALVNNVLEGFSLLRLSRRLFISYKRNESRGVAIQLFEKLEQAGFDVFLDTHSIRKGDDFQDELWHRLVDTDVVVLLNTPGFLKSEWTAEELARANAMSIGILQLIWPENTSERTAELSIPFKLELGDFLNGSFNNTSDSLTDNAVKKIIKEVESLRARSLAARQDNIVTEFVKLAELQGKRPILHREKFITINSSSGNEIVIIPTIGIPHAFSYHQSEDLIKLIRTHKVEKIYLLYDHRNIREKWLRHLSWLDAYLPVNSFKITDVDRWIKKI